MPINYIETDPQAKEYLMKAPKKEHRFTFAIIGYGPSFNMAPQHINAVTANKGFELAGICDVSADRRAAAKSDYPDAKVFGSIGRMLSSVKPDLTIIITPHYLHAKQALQCMNAGSSVVVEKPMCVTTSEVKKMLATAKRKRVTLSTYHNRRWDRDFVVLRDLIQSNVIGDVFRIEAGQTGYSEQKTWWRADKKISGGAIYDWGAHFTDWILQLVPTKIDYVTGFQVKNPRWKKYTNEDHSELTIRFKDNCLATLTISNLAMNETPRWRILGSKGAIVDRGDKYEVTRNDKGENWTTFTPFDRVETDYPAYYKNVCDHIRDGVPLVITPESAGRVIGVLAAANESAGKGSAPVKPVIQ
jgi:scyllo-inositol 2-dehydrogenase (NADP+)